MHQKAHHRLVVGLRREARVREQGFDLGGEDERPRRGRVVEGLDPEAVAGAEQPAPRTVPHGEREHAVEPPETVFAPPPVGLQQHFRIGAGGEAMPQRLELGAQLLMIVDLAVKHDPDVGVAHRQGLQAPVGQIENRQASVSQSHRDGSGRVPPVGVGQKRVSEPVPSAVRPRQQEPLAIRPPMPLAIVHPLQRGHVDRSREADDPYDPAHRAATPAGSPRSRVSQGPSPCTIIPRGGVKNYADRRTNTTGADLWRTLHSCKRPSPEEARSSRAPSGLCGATVR